MSYQYIISLKDIQFRWPGDALFTLNIPQWHIAAGERVFLQGASGSGKSTLLNLISGLLQAEQGAIRILGHDVASMSQRQRDRFRARHMGVIFQGFNLLPYLSVLSNIQLSRAFSGAAIDSDRVVYLLEQLGLSPMLLEQKASCLSVGQQQRVAIARAFYHQPEIIIADEPTSALDADAQAEFIELLLRQSENNKTTVLFVSHDKSLATHFDQRVDLQAINRAGQGHYAV